jgi:predicted enzyme related to lactoylglutathione lyase
MKPKAGPWPAKMAFYIDVDDIDSYSERIRRAGGKIVVAKTAVSLVSGSNSGSTPS